MKIISFIVFMFYASTAICQDSLSGKDLSLKSKDYNQSDTTVYTLIIIDPGFESWLSSMAKPKWYYTNEYLRAWNLRYVDMWNYNYINRQNSQIIESMIDYQPGIDYGLDINYKLYEYFLYVENELHLKLLHRVNN